MDILKLYKRDIKNIKNPTDIEKCLPLVIKIATQFQINGVDIMDLIQAGNIGLILAHKNYKSKDVKFSTYAYKWITGEMKSLLDSEIGLSNLRTEVKDLLDKEDPSMPVLEYEIEEQIIAKDLINKFKKTLPDTQRQVFEFVLEQGYTQTEAAKEIGIAQKNISTHKTKLLEKFKDFSEKE